VKKQATDSEELKGQRKNYRGAELKARRRRPELRAKSQEPKAKS
jgi:hypothetical protein